MSRSLWLVPGVVGALVLGFTHPLAGQTPAEQAQQLFQKALKLEREKSEEALALLRQAVELEPRNDTYLLYAGQYARQAGRYAEGLAFALKAIEINPKRG